MLKLVGGGVVVVMLCLHHFCSTSAQKCSSNQELQNSLRQVEKMLATHEASYQQSLRTLRKKLGVLQNSTMFTSTSDTKPKQNITMRSSATKPKPAKNATCPKPDVPAHGRRLGRVFGVGHEVHFLCKAGYDLMGPRTRVCLESLKWSGTQPKCRLFNATDNSLPSFSAVVAHAPPTSHATSSSLSRPASSSVASRSASSSSVVSRSASSSKASRTSSSSPAAPSERPASSDSSSSSPTPPPPSSSSLLVRPSRCTQFLGSTHCTCDMGFTISGRDNNVCTDIDECQVFPLGQPGRLCVYRCVNTAGSFHCLCPAGYQLSNDGRSCTDIDECAATAGSRLNNCSGEQVCVNTYGGFECVSVECPRMRNATYIKTSSMRCERNPCMQGDRACAQAPNSVSFHHLPVVSNMTTPRVLFRVSAARVLGDTLRFGLVEAGGKGRGQGAGHFSVQRSGRQTGTLLLVNGPVAGPAALSADVEMSELERGRLLGRYLTKVTVFVSPYHF